ncbi:hypothetical protein [Niallia sp. Krafla_26]|uniref:hypothetical protein n=1 Tax=Niallia sp. Krafla_26 TaxID=3064703 RepID=UPI003D17953E
MAIMLLVVVLFSIDKSVLGSSYIGVISFGSFALVMNYIHNLEKKADMDKK